MKIKDSLKDMKFHKCLNCGKDMHIKQAIYCAQCGEKLISEKNIH
ncbi:hypothetical protein SD77_2914 [Bacillus badius]|uniref:Zinc-ribbon domain-containing protein n=1 Tax=Bacillus badius TaxID=1455 RepID=A0ABR5APB3_BACBA|nr:hypothetical protein SD77_2914 [Bacillus badius]